MLTDGANLMVPLLGLALLVVPVIYGYLRGRCSD